MILRLKPIRDFLTKPMKNKKGMGFIGYFVSVIGSIIAVTFISWIMLRATNLLVSSRAKTNVYKLADAIAETGGLTVAMQDELNKSHKVYKNYVGDYEIKYYTYNYSNPGSKVLLGTSVNGVACNNFTVPSGQLIYVTFKATKTPLDKINSLLNPGSVSVGLAEESAEKVD